MSNDLAHIRLMADKASVVNDVSECAKLDPPAALWDFLRYLS
jgi:hypothetical protein